MGRYIYHWLAYLSSPNTYSLALSTSRALLYLPSFSQADIHHRVVLRARLARLLDPGSKRIDSLLESNKGNVLCKKRPQERERERSTPQKQTRERQRELERKPNIRACIPSCFHARPVDHQQSARVLLSEGSGTVPPAQPTTVLVETRKRPARLNIICTGSALTRLI